MDALPMIGMLKDTTSASRVGCHPSMSIILSLLLWGCTTLPVIVAPTSAGIATRKTGVNTCPPSECSNAALLRTDEEKAAAELLDATLSLIDSEQFRQNLQAYGQNAWSAPFGKVVPPSLIAAAYLGNDPVWHVLESIVVWVGKNDADATATTSLLPLPCSKATIQIGRSRLKWWNNGTTKGRGCAINTLAHELSHAIPEGSGQCGNLFRDKGFHWAMWRPLVSYKVGGIAECTYRQLQEDPTARDMRQCVDRASSHPFDPTGCD